MDVHDVYFSRKDEMAVLLFLSMVIETANDLKLTDYQLFRVLSRFIAGYSNECNRSALALGRWDRAEDPVPIGIWNWTHAVNRLLRSNSENNSLYRALSSLLKLSHNKGEDEEAFMQRLDNAHARCGYPLDTESIAARFMEGLYINIRPFVRRIRKQHRARNYWASRRTSTKSAWTKSHWFWQTPKTK